MNREDLAFAGGLVLIIAGLLGFDWRIASIVAGVAICGAAWFVTWKAAHGDSKGIG